MDSTLDSNNSGALKVHSTGCIAAVIFLFFVFFTSHHSSVSNTVAVKKGRGCLQKLWAGPKFLKTTSSTRVATKLKLPEDLGVRITSELHLSVITEAQKCLKHSKIIRKYERTWTQKISI